MARRKKGAILEDMKRKTRRILFYFFLICFLIIAPVTILYAAGWRVDWQNKDLVRTGAIYLKSQPKGARIFIDSKLTDKTPANINGLFPKEYQVLIEKEGYYSWQKKIKVYSSLVSEAPHILLIPQELSLNQLFQQVKDFIISPNKKRLAYISQISEFSQSPGGGIWVVNLNDNSQTQLALDKDLEYQDWQWSSNNQKLLLKAKIAGQDNWLAVDIEKPLETVNLTKLLGLRIEQLNWHPTDNKKIFYLQNNNLFQVNYLEETSPEIILEDVLSYMTIEQGIYFIQKPNNILYRFDLLSGNKQQLTLTPLPLDKNYQIFVSSDGGKVVVLSSTGQLYFLQNKKLEPLADNIIGLQFSQNKKKLLAYSEHEILVIWLENDTFYQTKKEIGQKDLITRYSEKIEKACWYKGDQHIIFNLSNQIKITELDGRDQRNTFDINQGKKISCQDKNLYFINQSNLYQTKIVQE